MDKVKKNFGFGCMRLPMSGEEIDKEQFKKMIDEFMDAGFNYFDTAHGYINEKSEPAIRECLAGRYPRESYVLTDKLSGNYFEKEEDIRPLFQSQLKACGVEYFDFYLMHAQNAQWFEKFKRCRAYETAFALKEDSEAHPQDKVACHNRKGLPKRIFSCYFHSISLTAVSSSSRMGSFWGQISSHRPHFTQSEAFPLSFVTFS